MEKQEVKSVKLDIKHKKLVIFDGVCNLCNAWVDFLIRNDKHGQFFFTPNQSEAGRQILEANGKLADEVSTVYFWDGEKLYERSTAALHMARLLPFPWKLAYGFIILPVFLRDSVYNWVAKNRYRWFGKKDTCRIPSPEEKASFI